MNGAIAREPAATAGPAAVDEVPDEQEDGSSGDGGEPGGEVEESLQGMDVEDLGGGPAAGQCPDDPDHAGEDEALLSPAGDQHIGDQARGQTENDPCDNAHTDSKVSDQSSYALISHAE